MPVRDCSVLKWFLFLVGPPGGFVPGASSVAPPGMHQPYQTRVDGRDSTLRSQQSSIYPQNQVMPPGELILLLFMWHDEGDR